MKILLTGSDGYLGCLVAEDLLLQGHEVTGLDTGFYRNGWLYAGLELSPRTITKDIREIRGDELHGYDAIVHMAELSNDPLGELNEEITYEVNYQGSARLAQLAKEAGVRRFVYMSSCSVYGVSSGGVVDESSPVDPQTAYARCKTLVEASLHQLADDGFSPTMLRNATAFGASPRMRFDIVLNNLAGLAYTSGEISMTSDGTPWRPLVHARDIGKAIACTLAAPLEVVHDQVVNVGSNDQNYQVRDIAETVAQVFTGCRLSFGEPGADNRSYRVDFSKASDVLPGFTCDWSALSGAEQLQRVFTAVNLDPGTFLGSAHTRLKQLELLLATQQLDASLFWNSKARGL